MNVRFSIGGLVALFFSSLLWSLNLLLFLYTLLLYSLLYWLPTEHWTANLLLLTMPVAWFFNLAFLVFWFFTEHALRSVLSGLVLLMGMPFWPRTFSLNDPEQPGPNQPTFSLLSYNVMRFDAGDHWELHRPSVRARHLTSWVVRHDAPVKCFQEFYNSPETIFNTLDRLDEAGYTHRALLHPELADRPDAYIGVAILSRYPIVKQGRSVFSEFNGMVWADIKFGVDTIRVINVHMQSMGIRVGNVLDQEEMVGVRQETRGILGALRHGFVERRQQVRQVEDVMAGSPHPVILTGDFNDTPYSTVYERLRRQLRNAFEDRGRGLGFTLNRSPSFIRIDNQFYDAHYLHVLDFQTLDHVIYSDHFPICGNYVLK